MSDLTLYGFGAGGTPLRFGRGLALPGGGVADWVSLLATETEIATWNTRKTTGPFASVGDFDNGNAGDASNPGEYDAIAAVYGTTWSTDRWAGPSVYDVDGYVDTTATNEPSAAERADALEMLGASFKCLMDDRASAGSGDTEATAIMAELQAYAAQANLDFSDTTLYPKLSTNHFNDQNPFFFICLWANRLMLAYSNCAALVGTDAAVEQWFSDLAYLAEHELHISMAKLFPQRKSDDYETNRWASSGSDSTTAVWGDEADGTDVHAMSTQVWFNNRRINMATTVLLAGVLNDDATLIAEGERWLREWMGFGINTTTTAHGDFNRDSDSASLPQLGIEYHLKAWREMMAAVDAAYRKGYTTAKTQTTSIGFTHATWGTAVTDKSLEDCIAAMASWVDESIVTQVYTPPNAGYQGTAAYRRCPVTPAGNMYYIDGWLVRAAAMFNRSDWRDAARRVGTPTGFTTTIQNDGGISGTRVGHWDRFLDPWDDRLAVYG